MFLLAFDTETTGFTQKHLPPIHPDQPNLVQLAAILLDTTRWKEMASVNLIVKPEIDEITKQPKWHIPEQASNVHGIKHELAMALGVPMRVATACFTNLRRIAHATLAHNLEYDRIVMQAAIHRCGGDPSLLQFPPTNFCTMRLGENTCKIPPTIRMVNAGMHDKFKAPNLQELHSHYLGCTFEGAHDAMEDIRAAVRCFRKMVELGEVKLP